MRLIVVILLAMVGAVFAEPESPGIVTEGLDYYYRYGTRSAVEAWLKGSPVPEANLTEPLSKLEQAYGKMVGFEKIRVVPVCPSFVRVYALIKYERGPGFICFDCYRPDADGHRWIISWVNIESGIPDRLSY